MPRGNQCGQGNGLALCRTIDVQSSFFSKVCRPSAPIDNVRHDGSNFRQILPEACRHIRLSIERDLSLVLTRVGVMDFGSGFNGVSPGKRRRFKGKGIF